MRLVAAAATCAACADVVPTPALNSAHSADAAVTSLYASPTGTGSDCSLAQPCSLTGAQQKVRTLNGDMATDIDVNLLDGVYHLASTFTLRENATTHDSGTNGFNVVYQAAPGARPILSGGLSVSNWVLFDAQRNIYRAPVPMPGLASRQLYVNGIRAVRARLDTTMPGVHSFVNSDISQAPLGWSFPDPGLASLAAPTRVQLIGPTRFKEHRCQAASIAVGWHNDVVLSNGSALPARVGFGDWNLFDWLHNGGQGTSYHVGDFDGDGYDDLLFSYLDGSAAWHNDVALSGRDKAFHFAGDWLPGGGQGTTYHIGDFNRDGLSDLLFSYYDGSNVWHNYVALSGRDKAFHFAGDWLPNAGQGTSYQIGDFDGDGRSDLLFSYYDGSNVWHNYVVLSTGSSFQFAGDWLPNAGQGTSYQIGDFNGDHRSDLLFSYYDSSHVWHNYVALSTGSSFQFAGDWLLGGGQNAAYHVGDFDGDGVSDLLFSYTDSDGGWHNEVALSDRSAFHSAGDWLPGFGQSAMYQVGRFGDFDPTNTVRRSDLLLASYQTDIQVQQPCWDNANMNVSNFDQLPWVDRSGVAWLENAYEFLDQPGEWYLDSPGGYVYYRPRNGEDLATANVTIPVLETLVDGQGSGDPSGQHTYLHNVQFNGLTFAFATWLGPDTDQGLAEMQANWHHITVNGANQVVRIPGAVTFSIASQIQFEGDVFSHLGEVGLNFDTASQHNAIVGNAFRDLSSAAIQVGDIDLPTVIGAIPFADRNFDNTARDNYIADVGIEFHGAVGMFFGISDSATISHNELFELPYTGISIGWGWSRLTGSYAENNRIADNWIHSVAQKLIDTGTTDWARVLRDGDASVAQITRNVLQRLRTRILGQGPLGTVTDASGVGAFVGNDGFQHAVVGSTTAVTDLFWIPMAGVQRRSLPSIAQQSALCGFAGSDGFDHVIVGTTGGALQEIYWQGSGAVGTGPLFSGLGSIVALAGFASPDGFQHAVALAANGVIHEVYWLPFGGGLHHDVFGTIANAVSLAGYFGGDGLHHVIVASSDGTVRDLSWPPGGSVSTRTLGSTAQVTALGAYYASDHGDHHVVAAEITGCVRELAWTPPAAAVSDMLSFLGTGNAPGATMVAAITAYFSPGDGYHHAIAALHGGVVQEIFWKP